MNISYNNWKVWLIKSTFGLTDNDKLPTDLCSFVKRLLFSILMFPIIWFSHVVNVFSKGDKVSWHQGLIFSMVGVFVGWVLIDEFKINILSQNSSIISIMILILLSPISMLCCIIIILIPICVGYLIIEAIGQTFLFFENLKINKFSSSLPNKKNRHFLIEYVISVKNKYCKKIDYF